MKTEQEVSQKRACPLCASLASRFYLQKRELHLVQCARCSMIYTQNVAPEILNGEFYNNLGVPLYLSPDKLESDYASVRFERELRLFRRFCASGNVLDVGCSTGAFLYQLKNPFPKEYEVTGTDVSQPAVDYAESRGVKIVREPFLNADFGGKTFSAITFWAVMEHLLEPKKFLRKAAMLLKAKGCCFILVPNLNSL
ncbi:MAG: class I SAM-dependent methyltransferase, partial [Verrucomicrobiota bacterium]